jgi:hypothetical protein
MTTKIVLVLVLVATTTLPAMMVVRARLRRGRRD